MTAEEIAEKMWDITAEHQNRTGMTDEAVDKVIEHCFRKMQLTNQPTEYILLLLPDELRNHCFRCMVNAASEILHRKEKVQNV